MLNDVGAHDHIIRILMEVYIAYQRLFDIRMLASNIVLIRSLDIDCPHDTLMAQKTCGGNLTQKICPMPCTWADIKYRNRSMLRLYRIERIKN